MQLPNCYACVYFSQMKWAGLDWLQLRPKKKKKLKTVKDCGKDRREPVSLSPWETLSMNEERIIFDLCHAHGILQARILEWSECGTVLI